MSVTANFNLGEFDVSNWRLVTASRSVELDDNGSSVVHSRFHGWLRGHVDVKEIDTPRIDLLPGHKRLSLSVNRNIGERYIAVDAVDVEICGKDDVQPNLTVDQ